MHKIPTYDVLIVGAGLSGCAAAISLKKLDSSLSVGIVERKTSIQNAIGQNQSSQRIGETVPAQIEQLLSHLDLLEKFKSQNYKRSYGTAAAWGSDDLRQNEFIYSTSGYGYVVDRLGLDSLMQKQARNLGIKMIYESSLYNPQLEADQWKIQCVHSKTLEHRLIKTRFVIDASGRKAAFTSLYGVDKIQEDKLVSLYFHLPKAVGKNKSKGTLIESNPFGWWYSNTLPDGCQVLALMTDADLAKQQNFKNNLNFLQLLRQSKHTKMRFQQLEDLPESSLVAAQSQHLKTPAGDAWLAIGDAASCYDPLSSLGMYKSLQTAIYGSYAAFDWLKGKKEGIDKYNYIFKNALNQYHIKKQEYYSLENRYSQEAFWQRRRLIA